MLQLPLGDLRDFPPPPGFHLRLAPQKELQLRPDIAPVPGYLRNPPPPPAFRLRFAPPMEIQPWPFVAPVALLAMRLQSLSETHPHRGRGSGLISIRDCCSNSCRADCWLLTSLEEVSPAEAVDTSPTSVKRLIFNSAFDEPPTSYELPSAASRI